VFKSLWQLYHLCNTFPFLNFAFCLPVNMKLNLGNRIKLPILLQRSWNVTPYKLDTDWHISHKLSPCLYPLVTSHPKQAKWKQCNWYHIRNTLVLILQAHTTYCTPSHNPTRWGGIILISNNLHSASACAQNCILASISNRYHHPKVSTIFSSYSMQNPKTFRTTNHMHSLPFSPHSFFRPVEFNIFTK